MKTILRLPLTFFTFLIGRFTWTAPPWLQFIARWIGHHSKLSLAALLLLGVATGGYFYYAALPKPIMVKAQIDPIQVTPNYAGASPSTLDIRFEYDMSQLKSGQARPTGLPSVARMDLVGEAITTGIRMEPAKQGQWQWLNDRHIRFVPSSDWPAGTEYTVSFSPSLFTDDTVLSEKTVAMTTPAMTADFSNIQFYQDPVDISIRRVVATLTFSHPVDQDSLERHLHMGMRPSGQQIESALAPYQFTVTYDKQYREAYIQSEPVALPKLVNYMRVSLSKGTKTILGGSEVEQRVETKVLIPDVYSFLKITSHAHIVRNAKQEPTQVITLDFTDEVTKTAVREKLTVYLLPRKGERNGKGYWNSPREITANILADSTRVDYALIPNERAYAKLYSLRVDVPEGRYLYLKMDKGLTSVNQFVHAASYDNVMPVPPYPKDVDIVGEGSVLTYSGNHSLTVLTRGVSGVKYTIGKLLKGQLSHLISQTAGDINNPDFKTWGFNTDNIADFETTIVPLKTGHPKTANYSSIDLTRYLPEDAHRFGLFFIEASGYDYERQRDIYGARDKRLILITDLGLIVKNNADSTHDVFVQSIVSGEPVGGAEVTLLGRNGVAVFSGKTNEQGRVSVPATDQLHREKQPTVYIVKSGEDLSFIPFERQSRQINLSRFDVGGVQTGHLNSDSLNAYLFTDRGIYRPGETINIGMIVKRFNLANIDNIPLELVIYGPENKSLKVSKFTLPEKGFDEIQFPTEATANTGRYHASLHLVATSGQRRYRGEEIGSISFQVEAFQPDTLKIESRLSGTSGKGWNTQEKLTANIYLSNLFGTAAQDRKVQGRLVIEPYAFDFKAYEGYQFTDPHFDKTRKPLSLDTALGNTRTDADGKADFDLDLSAFKQGTYRLRFTAEGFEQSGGRSVSATNTILVSPLKTLVGYKADGQMRYIKSGSDREVEFIAIDHQLKKQAITGLTLTLKAIQPVSTLVKLANGTYQYQTVRKETELSSQELSLGQAGYVYAIDTKTPGDFALEVYDAGKRRLSRVDFSVAGFANLAGKIDKHAELQVKLNKQDYKAGETIDMHIKAPYYGSGLITIETDRVLAHKWFKTSEESSVQHMNIPDDLEGTGYINVAFARDISSKEVFTSPLSYAVVPFSIDRSKRRVDIDLKARKVVRPGKPMAVSFSTSRPARIAIFAVDEGILQVAHYATPDPLSHFFKKRALGVGTLQILDLILPDFDVVKALSASGGGRAMRKALAKNLNPFARKTDKPAVFWSGIQDANETVNTVTFDVPDTFAGELRVMAVAVTEDAVGATSAASIVRGPFVISPNVLTHAAPGDEFLVTVGITNIIEGSGKNAEIRVTADSSDHLEIIGQKQTTLIIDEGSEKRLTVKVRAKETLGAASLAFSARHKDEEATRTASLSVRPATAYHTQVTSGFAKSGRIRLNELRTVYNDLAEQYVAASTSPLVLVGGLQSYLKTFPHGCTEQVISKVFPLIGLAAHPAYSAHAGNIKQHFSAVVSQLRGRQLSGGGFSFWPGQSRLADYPSIYAMHFLLEASEQGYPVPTDMMQAGKRYLKSYIETQGGTLLAARNRAYGIYLLTRMGEVTTNYLVDLEENVLKAYKKQWQSDILAAYMAATYQLLQKNEEAKRLISGYKSGVDHDALDDFHSSLAVDAQYIYLLSKHFQTLAKQIAGQQVLTLTDQIARGNYNTLSAAYAILALGEYSKRVSTHDADETITFGGLSATDEKTSLKAVGIPFLTAHYHGQYQSLTVDADKPLFYMNVQSGFSDHLPDTAIREGIEIYRTFVDENGNPVTRFEQGKELTVKLKVRALNGKYLTNIAIIDLLPGGFEVLRSSISRTVDNWHADYVDVREDRVIYYGSFDSTVRTLSYKVKLTAAGNFVIPPSYAESMYDRKLYALSKGANFTVIAAQ